MTDVFNAYAAYYDLLYQDKDYAGEARYVRDLLASQGVSGGTILELGSGTGRHAEQFARMGFAVHGVDMSRGMVDAARQRIPDELSGKLSFQQGDVRSLRIGKTYDAVISLFHVASYQTGNQDILAMLSTAARHLKPGGAFVFDFWYGPGVLTDPPTVRIKRMQNNRAEILRIAEPTLHPSENLVDVQYTVLVSDRASRQVVKIQEKHAMRYFFLPEMRAYCDAGSLKIVHGLEWMTMRETTASTWTSAILAIPV